MTSIFGVLYLYAFCIFNIHFIIIMFAHYVFSHLYNNTDFLIKPTVF